MPKKEYRHKTVAGFFSAHRDRWIKGKYNLLKKGAECFCLAGKVQDLYEDEIDRRNAFNRLSDTIEKLHPTIFKRITEISGARRGSDDVTICFNDRSGITIDEVVEVSHHARV